MRYKKTLIETNHPKISISEQLNILELNKSSYYYEAKPLYNEEKQNILNQMDEIFTSTPFYGYRRMHNSLKDLGILIGKDRVLKYMHVLGLKTFYPKNRRYLIQIREYNLQVNYLPRGY